MNIEDRFRITHEGVEPLSGEFVPKWTHEIATILRENRTLKARVEELEYLNKVSIQIVEQLKDELTLSKFNEGRLERSLMERTC